MGNTSSLRYQVVVVLFAAVVYLGCCISPPGLMDDVDAVQAQIARNMLDSGDWVTARLDGVAYLEKSPMKYWMMAVSYMIFGVHDWSARIPLALSVVLLCWLAGRFGAWAFSERVGLYAGLVLATCVGLFLFTRIQIPDAILTMTITLAMWGFLRTLDDEESNPRLWAAVMAAGIGVGLLLKGLIAALFPIAGALLYLYFSKQLWQRSTWRRLHVFSGVLIVLAIAAPWHMLATLRNPPYFDFTMKSEPGKYHGFFWFYFFNEHVFRFLNMRHPRDYNTFPRALFWLFHLLWLFPWSVFLPAAVTLSYRPVDRAGRTRLLALCWTGFLLVFFTFSTTQEYYSMPCYPALALLIACAMAGESRWIAVGLKVACAVAAAGAVAIAGILWLVWNLPAPGDISQALTQNPEAYTLSLGHMGDLTLRSFAYLKLPLVVAGLAFVIGALGMYRGSGRTRASGAVQGDCPTGCSRWSLGLGGRWRLGLRDRWRLGLPDRWRLGLGDRWRLGLPDRWRLGLGGGSSPRRGDGWRGGESRTGTYLAMAVMMVLFLHAARLALVVFDPYLGSKPLAEAVLRAPAGQLIVDDQYYTFSSVFFYTNRRALLLNGRVNNLEYGSYAPNAPAVFIDDAKLKDLWPSAPRYYLIAEKPAVARLAGIVGKETLHTVAQSGGKFLFTNHADLR